MLRPVPAKFPGPQNTNTLGILIRVMPYIRVMGGKIVKSLIRVMPIIRVMPGKLKVYQSKFVI